MIGQTISHYKILEKLGEGGMGVVYKADDTKLRRSVALKFLAPELTRDAEAKKRFIHEAQAASALDHPNIAVVHEIDETDDGRSFICMAYYPGKTLKELIEEGPLPIDKAVDIAIQIADGLQRAHEAGIIHRDIKPANVILTERGEVKIVDFGIAKLSGTTQQTRTGPTAGTAAYMSPEQARGQEVDHRSDLFSLGIVLYEMVTGKRPFQGEHEPALLYAITNLDPAPPSKLRQDIPEGLEAVIIKLLAKYPAQRYQHAADVRKDLLDIAGRTSWLRPAVASSRLRLLRLPATLAIAMVAIGVIVLVPFWSSFESLFLSRLPEEKHIVVLPFTSIGGDSLNQAVCDGLMETLTGKITRLERFQGSLFVVPATDVRRSKVTSVEQARKEFGITLAITGSYQRIANRGKLILNLVDAQSIRQLKSEEVEEPAGLVADLEQQAITKLVTMLELSLGEGALDRLHAAPSRVKEANTLYLLGRGYLSQPEKPGYIDIAIEFFRQALKADSRFARAHAALGEAFWKKYEATKLPAWVDSAKTECLIAISLTDTLSATHKALGIIHRGTGNYAEALKEFDRALRMDSLDADLYRERAATYERLNHDSAAISDYKRAIELRPSYWAGYHGLGVFYSNRKQYQIALEAFREATRLAPENPRVFSNLGGVYYQLGLKDEARRYWERAIELGPEFRAYSNLGTLHYQEGRFDEAARMFERAVAIQPRDYRMWGHLGSTYEQLAGQEEKMRQAFSRAAELAEQQRSVNPHDANLLSLLAGYYAMLGSEHQAKELIARSLTLSPQSVQIMVRAAEIHERAGRRGEALRWIERLLKTGYPKQELLRQSWIKALEADSRFQQIVK